MTMLSAIPNIGEAAVKALLGYAVVFFGIILLMIVIMIMGAIFTAKDKKAAAEKADQEVKDILNDAAAARARQEALKQTA